MAVMGTLKGPLGAGASSSFLGSLPGAQVGNVQTFQDSTGAIWVGKPNTDQGLVLGFTTFAAAVAFVRTQFGKAPMYVPASMDFTQGMIFRTWLGDLAFAKPTFAYSMVQILTSEGGAAFIWNQYAKSGVNGSPGLVLPQSNYGKVVYAVLYSSTSPSTSPLWYTKNFFRDG